MGSAWLGYAASRRSENRAALHVILYFLKAYQTTRLWLSCFQFERQMSRHFRVVLVFLYSRTSPRLVFILLDSAPTGFAHVTTGPFGDELKKADGYG